MKDMMNSISMEIILNATDYKMNPMFSKLLFTEKVEQTRELKRIFKDHKDVNKSVHDR